METCISPATEKLEKQDKFQPRDKSYLYNTAEVCKKTAEGIRPSPSILAIEHWRREVMGMRLVDRAVACSAL